MRLIDKDIAIDKVDVEITEEDNSYNDGLCRAVQIIGRQKEVNAIPIEWIEEWGWKNGMSESMSLRVMIEDWEKENE